MTKTFLASLLLSFCVWTANLAVAEEVTTIELTNKLEAGKKTWLPSAVTAKPGKIKFKLVNTLAEPHGFNIAGVLPTPVVVQAKETKEVEVTITKAGTYPLVCHLHPAHVGSTLTVK